MKLWVIRSKQHLGYDTYDSAVVAAETEEEARKTHPNGGSIWMMGPVRMGWYYEHWDKTWPASDSTWVYPEGVIVEYLGETDRDICGVIVSSFNAG